MKRREILKYTALITGSAVAAPLVFSLSGCTTDAIAADTYTPQFFNDSDFSLVRKVVDVILPATDSPSASAVGVHKMIDDMVANVYPAEDKEDYSVNSKLLLNHLSKLKDIDSDALIALEKNSDEKLRGGYQALKQQAVAYYLNTAEVGTKFLNYLPVPGEYQGCIELSEVGGKAWAL